MIANLKCPTTKFASANKQVYKLRPIEILEIFDDMQIIDPTDDIPIRRYVPKLREKIIEDANFKPGFIDQTKAFMKFCKNKEKARGVTTFEQAEETLNICHYLINDNNLSYEDFINL